MGFRMKSFGFSAYCSYPGFGGWASFWCWKVLRLRNLRAEALVNLHGLEALWFRI